MKNIPILIILLITCPLFLLAQKKYTPTPIQKEKKYNKEIGLDISNYLIVPLGGRRLRTEFELMFKSRLEKGDIRIKLNRNGKATWNGDETFSYIQLNDGCVPHMAIRNKYHYYNTYDLMFGYTRNMQFRRFLFFLGLDAKIGLNRGATAISVVGCENGMTVGGGLIETLPNFDNNIGFVPVLGTKLPLTKRILLTFELGVHFNRRFGKWNLWTDVRRTSTILIENNTIHFERIINDIALTFLF